MTSHDALYDESCGGNRNRNNFISFPIQGPFYKATARALPWQPPGAHATDRMMVPSIFVETLFRRAATDLPAHG